MQIAKHELIRDSRLTLDEIECVRQYRQSERQNALSSLLFLLACQQISKLYYYKFTESG